MNFLRSVALLLLAATARAQYTTNYYMIQISTPNGRATENLSGYLKVAASSVTASTPTIVLDGVKGGVNASSFTATYGVKASTFTGDGSALTNLSGASIQVGTIDTSRLATDSVTTVKIINGAVDTTKLATDAVTTAKIINGAVDTTKLATDAVTNVKIINSAVDTSKLATDAVTTVKILNSAVTSAKTTGASASCGAGQYLASQVATNGLITSAGSCTTAGAGDVTQSGNNAFTGNNTTTGYETSLRQSSSTYVEGSTLAVRGMFAYGSASTAFSTDTVGGFWAINESPVTTSTGCVMVVKGADFTGKYIAVTSTTTDFTTDYRHFCVNRTFDAAPGAPMFCQTHGIVYITGNSASTNFTNPVTTSATRCNSSNNIHPWGNGYYINCDGSNPKKCLAWLNGK